VSPGEHRVATSDGGHLHVTAHGPAGPSVLLLHGVGSSRRFLSEAFGAPLAAAGWRLLAADLRGHGRASPRHDPADHALDRHVGDVVALVDHLRPDVVGGVSLGGHAAVAAAVAGLPCRAVVACLPAWSGRAVPGSGPHAAVAAEVARVGVDGMLARFADDTTMVPWLREVLRRDWAAHDRASLVAALTALDGGQAPTGVEVAGLRVPLAVVGWPDDPGHPLAVAEDWARTAPRGALATTTLHEVQEDRTALGGAAVAALGRLGVVPVSS
jgi:pimeloyl-ACP methyl ester carboxylesterase